MTSSAAVTVDHPFFARIWPTIAAHETEQMRELRRENLAGLSGRVLEVGAGELPFEGPGRPAMQTAFVW